MDPCFRLLPSRLEACDTAFFLVTAMNGRMDVQFLSANHNKFASYPPTEQKLSKQMTSSSSTHSDPRSAKLLHPFDLLSISDQLPPNTGPPGTVAVNGSSSSSTSNKNLSHVPCKFYRQGICQAGNSCPFSHNLDGTLAADKLPCKYFQKGNCKFGLKCALAHFLPDGTKVNSKSLLSYRRNNDRGDRTNFFSGYSSLNPGANSASGSNLNASSSNSASSGNAATSSSSYLTAQSNPRTDSTSSSNVPTPVSQPIDISANSLSISSSGSNGFSNGFNNIPISAGLNGLSSSSSSQLKSHKSITSSFHAATNNYVALETSSYFTSYSGTEWLVGNNSTATSKLFSTASQRLTNTSMMRSMSANSPPNFSVNSLGSEEIRRLPSGEFNSVNCAFHSPQTQYSTPYSKLSRYLSGISTSPQYNFQRSSESAVVDDDSEENYDDDDNAFLEDYVPASLGNLIFTPQERQRRNSRSQSGTLLVRPNILSNVIFDNHADKKAPSGDDVFLMD